jgi:hypothetical protein
MGSVLVVLVDFYCPQGSRTPWDIITLGSSHPGVFSSSHSIISGPSGGPGSSGGPVAGPSGRSGISGLRGRSGPRVSSGGPSGPSGSGSPGEALTTSEEEVYLLSVLVVIEEVTMVNFLFL